MIATYFSAQSDPALNRHFRRRWTEPPMPVVRVQRPMLRTRETDRDPTYDLLVAWRDEWRARRRRAA